MKNESKSKSDDHVMIFDDFRVIFIFDDFQVIYSLFPFLPSQHTPLSLVRNTDLRTCPCSCTQAL
jgi:hypothetical protein